MMLAFAPWGFEIPLPVIVLGAIIGMTYGLLAVGLVLVYRTNRIINFAHGEIGAFGAAVFGTAVIIVEQSVTTALRLSKRAIFMEKGEIRFDGPSQQLLKRDDLLRAVFLEGADAGRKKR